MGLSAEMKNLSDELLASFKLRLKANEDLVNDVQKTLDGFHKDHMEMAAVLNAKAKDLRKGLADGETERLDTFHDLMSGINKTIASIQAEVTTIQPSTIAMINDFSNERAEMADELNKFFAKGKSDRKENEDRRMMEFNDDIKDINNEVMNIFKNTNDMLDRFDKEHLDMSNELRSELGKNLTERVDYTRNLLKGFQKKLADISKENQKMAQMLRKDLAKGETTRLNNYNSIMKGIHQSINDIRKEVSTIQKSTSSMINDLTKDRGQANATWFKMQDAMAKLRKSGINTPASFTEKKSEVVTQPKINEVQPVTEPVFELEIEVNQQTEVPEPAETMTLEDKILEYINKHPGGVKVSEMEVPLNEIRMKLGYSAKTLLNEGKIQKKDNVYFPIN